jgi:hypothetical protein
VLGVVIVLDDQPALGGPSQQLASPLPLQDHAHRELVGGGEDHHCRPGGSELVDPEPAGVHGHGDGA